MRPATRAHVKCIGRARQRSWAMNRSRNDRTSTLPERVRRAIRDEQDRAERLIGWCQMALVLFFAAFYVAAPKPADQPMHLQPVPVALALYFGATLARLAWTRRRRVGGAGIAVSIVVDMALLFGLIWSFHVQYAQPPAFYLKAPTLLYVFIFIALRALRFEAWPVLFAGVVAAIGWIAMVAYAALAGADDMPITRDYVRYLTSNTILVGAEIDKVVSIVVVSAILGWALHRARRMLVTAVAGTSAARELRRFFSAEVASAITSAEESVRPGEGVLRHAAAMFIDLRGFAALSQGLSADATVQLIADYQARMVPVLRAQGGSIDKFLGDGILASFGAVRPSATCAADALRAADAVMAEAAAWAAARRAAGRPAPRVGLAVAVGELVFGAVGDESRLEYTVIGDAVNLAAKLEKHTKVEKVDALTTRAAYEEARAQGYAAHRPVLTGRRVAGIDGELDLVVLG
jgi:adenylate cyclase